MAEYILTKKSNLVAVANSVRKRTGGTGKITLGEMIDDINYVIGGIDTSDATASENEILLGETAYVDGEKITGTIPTKTASNLTVSGATVTVPAGYYASQATKSVATATQATPSVSIDSAGKITASATQTAGYVSAGTKSSTKQLTVQAAKTITPSTSSQTAVAKDVYTTGAVTVAAIPSTYVKPTATKAATTYTPTTSNQTISAGTYCSGAQTIKGDANLTAENIKSGVSIFGVNGSYEGSGGSSSGGVSDISTSFTLELTEEMYQPGANLYTLVPNTSFNINNCASFGIVFKFTRKVGTSGIHTDEHVNIAFRKFSISDEIQCDSRSGNLHQNTLTGMFITTSDGDIQLIGTVTCGSNYRLSSIVGTGILIQ